MRVLVGGGTGFIGKHLKSLLTKQGHHVLNISRKSAPGTITWSEIKKNGLPDNTEDVVNLAGENIMNFFARYNEAFKAKLRASRIESTKLLADTISKSGIPPKVFISSSAIGYYKPSLSSEYTEDSTPGEDFFARLCVDWESAAQLAPEVKCRHVCVRIGLACGRDGGVVQNTILPFWMGTGGRIGSGQQWFPWIHVDDVCGIIAHAIHNEHVTGVLNAVAPTANTNNDFTKAFASALNRPAFLPVPAFAVNMIFGTERGSMLLEGTKVIPTGTLESGYKFQYSDLDSACREFGHLF